MNDFVRWARYMVRIYKVELLFSFKGIKRVEVPEERIHRA